jgi:hypothetical protein
VSPRPSLLTAESSVVGQPLLFTHHIIRCLPFLPAVEVTCNQILHLFILMVATDCLFGNTAFSGTIVCLPDDGRINK